MDYLLIIAGFILLTTGANILINGATGLAAKFNISTW
jgi:Ca2+/Na+ antiporter